MSGAVIDCRAVRAGALFAAIPGERVDGHDYIGKAFDRGASCCLAQRGPAGETRPVICVPDTAAALEVLARAYRARFAIPVLGVTGSVGKTTTIGKLASQLKKEGNQLVLFTIDKDEFDLPKYDQVMTLYTAIRNLIQDGAIVSAYALDGKGLAAAVSKMAFGNKLGVTIEDEVTSDTLFAPGFGNIVAEVPVDALSKVREVIDAAGISDAASVVGYVNDKQTIECDDMVLPVEEAVNVWTAKLEGVFHTKATDDTSKVNSGLYDAKNIYVCKNKVAKPTVFIPVFPGTNCEYDSTRAFERAGAEVDLKVFKN